MKKIDWKFIIGLFISVFVSIILAKVTAIETFFSDHASFGVFFIFCLLLFTCFLFYLYFSVMKGQHELNDFSNKSTENKRYSIILVDDDGGFRQRYKKLLRNYEITILDSVDAARILYGFDIVILDIINASALIGNNTYPIIDELSFSKPDIYVIAISASKEEIIKCGSAGKVDSAICKNSDFDLSLKKEIQKAFELLDNPVKYWDSNVKKKIVDKKMEHIYKNNYINSLLSKSTFKHS